MLNNTKLGRYITDDKVSSQCDEKLSKDIELILAKLSKVKVSPDEKKKFLNEFKKIRLDKFDLIAPVIYHLLGSKNYQTEMNELIDKLDLYIKDRKDTLDSIIPFTEEFSSKIRYNATLDLVNERKSLDEEEIRNLLDKLYKDDQETEDKYLENYRNWYSNLNKKSFAYQFLKEKELDAKTIIIEYTKNCIQRIEEAQLRENRILTLQLSHRINDYKYKKKKSGYHRKDYSTCE